MPVKIEVWGDYACFSVPALKVERVSYDVITPSAARGLLESIYWHKGLRYVIDRIYVLNPIRFTNLRRNEVSEKASANILLRAMNGAGTQPVINASNCIQQRATTMLRDVRYVIEAHFDMTDEVNESDNAGKFQSILKRRLENGQNYSQPYLGCRELIAHVDLWKKNEIPAINETRDLGMMLYDMDYSDLQSITPVYFRARMEHGVIDLTNCEVFR